MSFLVNLKRRNPPALWCPGRVFEGRVIVMTPAITDFQVFDLVSAVLPWFLDNISTGYPATG